MGRRGVGEGIGLLLFLLLGLWLGVPVAWSAGPPQRENVQLISQVGGRALSVFVQGKVAYVGLGPSLHLVDVSNPASPQPLGQVTLPGLVEDVFVAGSLAYVANGKFGLRVVNVSDPAFPQEIGRLDTLVGYARGVFFSGGFAYVASGTDGLWVIDVSDPANLLQKGQWQENGRTAYGVSVSGSFAYVAVGVEGIEGIKGELRIIDVSDPANPLSKSSYPLPEVAYGVHVLGDFAYVADGLGGLRAVDVSDFAALRLNPTPRKAASYDTPGIASRVHVSLPYAYVADGEGGLRVINVENPAFFREVGHLNMPGFNWAGSALGVYAAGSTVYVPNGDYGLEVIDVSSPSAPQVVGRYRSSSGLVGAVADVFISGIYAYLLAFDYAFQIADISDPLSPVFKGFYDPPPPALIEHDPPALNIASLFVTDDWVGIADGGTLAADGQQYGFRAVQVTDPSAPFEDPLWTQHFPGLGILNPVQGPATDVFLVSFNLFPTSPPRTDILAYVATLDGLKVVDMSPLPTPPPNVFPVPVKLGDYPAAGARKVFVAANTTATHAYLVGDFGLKILDVTDPGNILEVGSLFTGGVPATSIFVNLPYAYVTVGAELWVIRVYDLATGQPLSSPERLYEPIPLLGRATGLFFSGSSAYVTIEGFGLQVFDFTDPMVRPASSVATFETPGQAMDLFIDQGRIYVADGNGGLFILRHAINPEVEVNPTALDFGEILVGRTKEIPITISNVGVRDLTVGSLTLLGSEFSLVESPVLPLILPPGASRTLTVRFSPIIQGVKGGSLTLSTNDPLEPVVQVALSGQALDIAQIALGSPALNFGDVALGSSKDRPLSISNTGTQPLNVTSLDLGGGSDFSLVELPALPLVLAPGASWTLMVRFSPATEGAKVGSLTLSSNDPDPNQATIEVALSGWGGLAPQIALSSDVLDFGDVPLGASQDLPLTVSNTGAKDLVVSSLGLVGEEFSLVGAVTLPFTIALGGPPQVIMVRFTPATEGAKTGSLTLSSNDPNKLTVPVTLLGRGGLAPQVVLSLSSLNFEETPTGTTKELIFTISNTGTKDLHVNSLELGEAEFSVMPHLPFTLIPGAGRQIAVRFSPASEGAKTGSVTVGSDDPDKPSIAVALSGIGVLVGQRNPEREQVELVSQVGGKARAIFVGDKIAYVGLGPSLHVVDVQNPAFPRRMGKLTLPGLVEGLVVSGSLAYVASGKFGLQVVDVSSPAAPQVVGHLDALGGYASGVSFLGSHAYVAAGTNGLQVIDVSDPARPKAVGQWKGPLGAAYGVHVSVQGGKTYAYVAYGEGGLQIIDVSNPAFPSLVASYTNLPDAAYDVHVSGSFAYIAAGQGGLRAVDVSNPASPRKAGSYDTPGTAYRVFVSQPYAYLADGSKGLKVINVENASFFWEVGSLATEGATSGIYAVGSTAYVADGDFGLKIIDVANPSVPRIAGRYLDPLGSTTALFLAGPHAYLAGKEYSLRVVDISDPLSPQARGFYNPLTEDPPRMSANAIFVTNDWVGVADKAAMAADGQRYGFRSIQVTNPSSPVESAIWTDPSTNPVPEEAFDVFMLRVDTGILAYVATQTGMRVVDLGPLPGGSPRQIGSYSTPGAARKVFVSADTTATYAYLAGDFGLLILDVSDPTTPTLKGGLSTGGPAASLFAGFPYLYLIAGMELWVIDVSDPALPTRLYDPISLPGRATGIFVSGSLAYVTLRGFGLQIFDFADPLVRPSSPVATYETAGEALAVFAANLRVYLADGDGGLFILRHTIGPNMEPASNLLDFGEVPLGSSRELHLTVLNAGTHDLIVSSLALDPLGTEFSLVGPPPLPFTLAPGASQDIVLLFRPTSEKPKGGTLTLLSNDPNQPSIQVDLAAVAIAPDIRLGSTELDFGTVAVDSIDELTLTVSNDGLADLTVTAASFDVSEFSLVSGTVPFTLASGKSRPIVVRFSPIGEGPRQGTLTLLSNDPDQADVAMALSGNAILMGREPPRRQNVELVAQVGGSSKAIFVQGKIAYMGQGSSLHVMDVSNPASPQPLGQVPLPGLVEDIFVSGSLAYVANGKFGLQVVDVSDPTAPQVIGHFDTLEDFAFGVYVLGPHAYVANNNRGLRVIDVSDPRNPQLKGTADTPGTAYDVAVSGSYAYVADGKGGLQVIDVSDPLNPRQVGSYPAGTGSSDRVGFATGVHVVGSYAYLADGEGGLRSINVSNPASPVKVGSYDTPGTAYRVFVSFPYAYMADREGGLRVINVEKPSLLWEIGFHSTIGRAIGVFALGATAYVAAEDFGMEIIDLSNPTAPLSRANHSFAKVGSVTDVFISGRHAYLPGKSYGFRIVDISDPLSPEARGLHNPPPPIELPKMSAASLFVTDNWAGVADHRGLYRMVDVTDPSAPVESSELLTVPALFGKESRLPWAEPVPGASNGFLLSRSLVPSEPDIFAYVAGEEGLAIENLRIVVTGTTRRILLTPVSSFPTSGAVHQVFVSTNSSITYAYLAGEFGLLILDVTNPTAPRFQGNLSLGAPAIGIFVSFPYAYALTRTGLWVVDVSDPTSPRKLYDPVPISGKATGILVAGPLAYVAVEGFGLQVFDFTDPLVRPERPVAFYETPGEAMDLFIDKARIYLADGDGGFFVLRHTIGPNIKPASTVLDFGEIPLGTSRELSFTVSNTGTKPLTVSSLSLGGVEFSFPTGPPGPFTLNPGDSSQPITVRFSPISEGLKQGNVTLESNDPDDSIVTVKLSGRATPAPQITLSRLTLDFGEVARGSFKDLSLISVSNTGTQPLEVTSLTLVGAEFSFPTGPPGPFTLNPGDPPRDITVRFSPTSEGLKQGALILSNNDPDQGSIPVELSGQVTPAPQLTLAPSALDFGEVVWESSMGNFKDLALTISNTGTRPLDVTSLTLVAGAEFSFPTGPPEPFTLNPGDPPRTITVRFSPNSEGPKQGALTLSSNVPNQPTAQVSLTGMAIAPNIQLDTAELDFGIVAVGGVNDLTFTVSNNGQAVLTVAAASFDSDQFSLVGPSTVPFTLAPGDPSRTIKVRFSPTSGGAKQGTLTLHGNDPDQADVTVALSGNAIRVGQGPPLRESVELVSQVGGSSRAIFVQGKIAYVGLGSSLHVVDVQDASKPKLLGRVVLPGLVEDIFVSATLAYVANGKFGLRVVDVSNPTSPEEIGSHDTLEDFAFGVYVLGPYAYVANNNRGLRVIDVSDPRKPELKGTLDTPGTAYDVVVSGSYAYVADGEGGLQVVDISDSLNPRKVGSYPDEGTGSSDRVGFATGVHVVGSYAYLADGEGGLRSIDVSNPASPVKVGSYNTPGTAYRVFVSFPYAYMADGEGGLRVINVEDPSLLWEIGFLSEWKIGPLTVKGRAIGVFALGTTTYVAVGDFGMEIIDLSNPTMPAHQGNYSFAIGSATDVFLSGRHAYLPARDYGFSIVDIFDPFSLDPRGRYNPELPKMSAASLFVTDNWAGVADHGNLYRMVDVTDPQDPKEENRNKMDVVSGASDGFLLSRSLSLPAPNVEAYVVRSRGLVIDRLRLLGSEIFLTRVSSYSTVTDVSGTFVVGSLAYVASGQGGLKVVDISQPLSPKEVGHLDTTGFAMGVHVSGPRAYVADGSGGVRIIGISDPTTLRGVGSYPTRGETSGVFVRDCYVYVADGEGGTTVLDICTATVPIEQGRFPSGGYASEVVVSPDGRYAYVADGGGGLLILDVSAPLSANFLKEKVSRLDTGGYASGIYLSRSGTRDYVYVANGFGGLVVVDVSNPALPQEVERLDTPGFASGVHVFLQGDKTYAYVAERQEGVAVIEVSNPSDPDLLRLREVARLGTANARKVFLSIQSGKPHAFVSDGERGLKVIEVSDVSALPPSNEWGKLDAGGTARKLFVSTNSSITYAYLAGEFGLLILDVTDINNPRVRGNLPLEDPAVGIFVSFPYAYLITQKGLWVVDVSDPTSPKNLYQDKNLHGDDHIPISGKAVGVFIGGPLGYVAVEGFGLQVFDFTDPRVRPTKPVATYETPGEAMDLFIARDRVYLADGDGGLFILRHTLPIGANIDLCLPDGPDQAAQNCREGTTLDFGEGTALDFGEVFTGASRDQGLVIKNTGAANLTVTSLQVDQAGQAGQPEFSLVSVVLPFTLAPGLSRRVTVRFSPTTTGDKSATLTMISNDPNQPPVTAALLGKGITLDFGERFVGTSQDQGFVIKNTGTADLTVTSLLIDKPEFSVVSVATPFTLSPGFSLTAPVRFSPATTGDKSATLTLLSNDPDEPTVTVALSGKGMPAADIAIDPPVLDFGNVGLGTARELSFKVINRGSIDLEVKELCIEGEADPNGLCTASGQGGPFSHVDWPDLPFTLKPNESKDLKVRFAPVRSGLPPSSTPPVDLTRTVKIVSNDPDSNRRESPEKVKLKGRAVEPPDIRIDPKDLNFERVAIGSSRELSFAVSNEGDVDLIITGISSDNDQFSMEPSAPLPVTLKPGGGQKLTVTLRFTPSTQPAPGADECAPVQEPELQSGVITVDSNDPELPPEQRQNRVTVSGKGFLPNPPKPDLNLSLVKKSLGDSSYRLDFGEMAVNGTRKDLSFTLFNDGTRCLRVEGISLTGEGFALTFPDPPPTPESPLILPKGGGSKRVTVRFASATEGEKTGSLTITTHEYSDTDPADREVVVQFFGSGALVPDIQLDRPALSFGPVSSGTSKDLSFNVRNQGSGPLSVNRISIDNRHFKVVSPEMPIPVPPKGKVSVTVRFSPTTTETQSGTLSLVSNDPDEGTTTLLLSGNDAKVRLLIDGGAPSTSQSKVTLTISASPEIQKMRFSNDGKKWSPWVKVSSSKRWTLAKGLVTKKTVWGQFKGKDGQVIEASDTIVQTKKMARKE